MRLTLRPSRSVWQKKHKMYKIAIIKYLEEHGFEAFRPKAVLFDMDGVLYDSMPNHAIAWQESMAKFGIHMTADDAYATEGARGVDTIRLMVLQQLRREIDEAEAQRMYDEKSRIFIQCGIVTGSGQLPLIQRLKKDFGAFVDEAHITTAYDVKHGKPAPDPYLMGLQKAGDLQPFEAIVVENAPLGVRSGHAARIFTIAVNTGPLPNEELLGAGADLIFPSMTELSRQCQRLLPTL